MKKYELGKSVKFKIETSLTSEAYWHLYSECFHKISPLVDHSVRFKISQVVSADIYAPVSRHLENQLDAQPYILIY